MNSKKYNEIKKSLLRKKAVLRKDEDSLDNNLHEETESRHGDSADIADSQQEQEKALFLLTKKHDELQKIDDALKKIEKGEYGECDECGEPISSKRLEILPYSIHCVECQEELENRQSLSY